MLFVFRVDASQFIGTGHVMRCLTLARCLEEKGAIVYFICRKHSGHLCGLIDEQGFSIYHLPGALDEDLPLSSISQPSHASWLGCSWEDDAQETITCLEELNLKPDWLVIDHYALDYRWEQKLRSKVSRIFVIDDLADRIHDCDLLLDQNLVPEMNTRYKGKVPESCGLLLGPEYALLQPEYAELHDRVPPRSGRVQRVLIYFGGFDIANITSLTLEALLNLNKPDIKIDVVLSDQSSQFSSVKKLASQHSNVSVYSSLPSLAPLMIKADLAIGAAGTTSWERLCLGLPTVAITIADNQRQIAHGLASYGLIHWIGHKDEVSEEQISKVCASVIDKNNLDWSVRCRSLVDGKGSVRVSSVLLINNMTHIYARRVRVGDEALLYKWANDPVIRHKSELNDLLSLRIYHDWFCSRLRDIEGYRLYIIETEEGIPIGQVQFEKSDEGWAIDYSIPQQYRAPGLGEAILQTALEVFNNEYSGVLVYAQVRESNKSSRKVFNHFNLRRKGVEDGRRLSISICSDRQSWMNDYIPNLLIKWISDGHTIRWVHDAAMLPKGNICFYLSYGKIVTTSILKRQDNNLVVHASNLPKGKGWSPLTWQILKGESRITVTLFEASSLVDSGNIYKQINLNFSGNELIEEMRRAIASVTLELCSFFITNYPSIINTGTPQHGEPTFYKRRFPKDSQINIDQSLKEQFNLFRTVDNKHYPAWFEYRGSRYILKIERMDNK